MLDNLVSDLEKYLKVSLIKEDKRDNKGYLFILNDGTEISLEQNTIGIHIHANICQFSQTSIQNSEDFYMYLMKANYLGQGTGDSIISIDPSEKFLTLSSLISYEVNYKMFRDLLEDFVNYLFFWKKEIASKVSVDE